MIGERTADQVSAESNHAGLAQHEEGEVLQPSARNQFVTFCVRMSLEDEEDGGYLMPIGTAGDVE